MQLLGLLPIELSYSPRSLGILRWLLSRQKFDSNGFALLKARVAYGTHSHSGHVPTRIKWLDLIQLASRIHSPKKIVAREATNRVFKIPQI